MATCFCAPSTSRQLAVDTTAAAHDTPADDAFAEVRDGSLKSRERRERDKEKERIKDLHLKRPSEPRSRRTPKGSSMRLGELQERQPADFLEDTPISPIQTMVDGCSPTRPNPASAPLIEVPLLSLLTSRRKGKLKALVDEYDFVPKPGSRTIITLEDDDQEFLDAWAPESWEEPTEERRGPLYSEVLRGGYAPDGNG